MSIPEEPHRTRRSASDSADDIFEIREPDTPPARPRPNLIGRHRVEPVELEPPAAEALAFPMFTGVFTFPFYFRCAAAWALIAVGLLFCTAGFWYAALVASFVPNAGLSLAFGIFLALMSAISPSLTL